MVTDGQGIWFAYRGFPFGFMSGPQVWGRTSADWRKECVTARRKPVSRLIIDDPFISLADICQQRDWAAAVTCVVWVKVRSDFARKRARFGNVVSWIGAELSDDRVSKIQVRSQSEAWLPSWRSWQDS